MNETDRMELNVLRGAMLEVFLKVARTPDNDREIEIFLKAQDRHQELLSQEGRGEE